MKVIKVVAKILFWLFFTALMIFLFGLKWLMDSWANLTIEELIYHLTVSLEGTNSDVVWYAILHYGLFALLLVMIAAVIFFILNKRGIRTRWLYAGMLLFMVVLSSVCFRSLDKKMGAVDYIKGLMFPSTFIEDNYVSPSEVEITFNGEKKNLIYIYLESLEVTFTDKEDGGAFQQNIIPEIVDLSREGEDFSGDSEYINGAISLYGATWTMGGMFAESTGLPLKTGSVNANYISSQNSIYPSVVAIGNILEDEGYNNELLLGSSAGFGGRRQFYEEHGNYFMFDYYYALDQGYLPPDYKVFWGFEDIKLYEFAKAEVERLHNEGKPFNLTMLTVDSHFEDGYRCELCGDAYYGGDQYSNVMACASSQVYNFICWLKEQDYYKDTVIVLSGDHPTMDMDFCANVSDDYQRKVITVLLNSDVKPEDPSLNRVYSTMDLFPTTLAAMGAEISGDRLGLGANLYSSESTLLEKYDKDYVEKELEKKSVFMNSLNAIEINDDLIRSIGAEANIETVSTEKGLEIRFSALVDFGSMEDFKDLEVEITHVGKEDPVRQILDSYNKEEEYYYNSSGLDGYEADNVIIVVYMVDKNKNKYELKRYSPEQ